MSVLKGEGKVPILFGTKSLVSGPITHEAYLARPDLTGEWPTIIVVPSVWGITSSMKDLARRIARQGAAVVVADLYRGRVPDRDTERDAAEEALASVPAARAQRDLADVIAYAANRAGFWSSAEDRIALMGIGAGGRHAVEAALRADAPLVLAGSVLPADRLASITSPVLGLYGKSDEIITVDDVMAAREVLPRAEWVLYEGVGHDFLDDYTAGYDDEATRDAVKRVADFADRHLPARV